MKNILIIVGLALLSWVIVSGYTGTKDDLSTYQKDYVYAICNNSRLGYGATEEECAQAQDETNTEFMCSARNSLYTNYCWVEKKQ